MKQFISAVMVCLLFTACGGTQSAMKKVAKDIAMSGGLQPTFIRTSTFRLKGYYRFTNPNAPMTVYIEGDGLAYLHRNLPSANPTPRNPIGLHLAALDLGANVLYLARPCQYVNIRSERLCSTPYWTQKRFAKEVIIAVSEAIDKMVLKAGVGRIHMVGYSGGGAVAAIVAARRKDVVSLRSVAGYMDHVSLNKEAGVAPLKGSLDPMRYAPRLKSIPQIHYTGMQDKRIPKWVAQNFRRAVGNKRCTSIRQVNTTHAKGWEKVWKWAWSKLPKCL